MHDAQYVMLRELSFMLAQLEKNINFTKKIVIQKKLFKFRGGTRH